MSETVTVSDNDRSIARIEPVGTTNLVEGDSGETVFSFEVVLDQPVAVVQQISWSAAGSGSQPADAADFAGSLLPSGSVTFAPGEDRKRVEIRIAGDTFIERDESFTVRLDQATPGLEIKAGQYTLDANILSDDGHLLGVKVYHWKTHALLRDVSLLAAQQADAGSNGAVPLFNLRAARLEAGGDLLVELWAQAPAGTQTLDLEVRVNRPGAVSFSREPGSLAPDWQFESNLQVDALGSDLLLSGFVLSQQTALSGAVRLGTLRVDLEGNAEPIAFNFGPGSLGTQSLSPHTQTLHAGLTGTDGTLSLGPLPSGHYAMSAHRPLGAGETGSVINSADALAALRLAVGINPNPDPDGSGSLTPLPVSPYQFISADVTGDGRVTSADALAILKMAVKRADAPAREWLFVDEQHDFWNEAGAGGRGAFTTTRSSVQWERELEMGLGNDAAAGPGSGDAGSSSAGIPVHLVALLKGDVNGSWSAPAGSATLPDSYFHELVAAYPTALHLNQFGLAPVMPPPVIIPF